MDAERICAIAYESQRGAGNHSSWDFRCQNQTEIQWQNTASEIADKRAKYKECGPSLPIALSGQNNSKECFRMAYWLWAHHSQQIHHLQLAKRSRRARVQNPTSHHCRTKLPSWMPMELHCIYLGRDRTRAWTKISQDQLDSTTGKLYTALLCCPAAVSTERVCQDLWAWK